jgi:hypothetical protein
MGRFARRYAMWTIAALVAGGVLGGCRGAAGAEEPSSGTAITRLDGTRWLWVESGCSDGAMDLAGSGFEQELWLSVRQTDLLMTHVTRLATAGCSTTEMWLAHIDPGGHFRFEPQAHVTLPAGVECGAVAGETLGGMMRLSGETLEVVTARSPWCRGFDARFVYRRVPPTEPDAEALVTRYVAHFNRRDPAALAALFSEAGSVVEPFSATRDGNYERHEGRDAIRAWYASAFEGTPWLAMRLLDIDTTDASGQVVATWEYMDANLKEPIRGRNLFVLAGGEIFETEVQLSTEPVPVDDDAADVEADPNAGGEDADGAGEAVSGG